LLPCDHGLLCAVALTLQGKREVGARQRDVAWTSAVQWIGQACHSGTMASSQNRSHGMRRAARCSTISTTMWPRPLVLAVDGRSALL
jgi:hypothetical protein